MKAVKPAFDEVPPIESDERHQADVDRFIERNRAPLNASIRRSRAEVEKGVMASRTIDGIIKDARRRHGEG